MDNNFLQAFAGLLGKKEQPQTQNCTMQGVPLYPSEAYPSSQNESTQSNTQNNLLPLLMSILSQNGGDISSALSGSNNSDLAALANFFNAISKKKKDKEKQENDEKKEAVKTSFEGQILKNEFFD